MKKLRIVTANRLTFEEGCNKYLENCRARNLREGTINHYKQSYTQFFKYFDPNMAVSDITKEDYDNYVLHLRKTLNNDVSINAYLRDFITTLHFLMNEGYVAPFQMQSIKVDKSHVQLHRVSKLGEMEQNQILY